MGLTLDSPGRVSSRSLLRSPKWSERISLPPSAGPAPAERRGPGSAPQQLADFFEMKAQRGASTEQPGSRARQRRGYFRGRDSGGRPQPPEQGAGLARRAEAARAGPAGLTRDPFRPRLQPPPPVSRRLGRRSCPQSRPRIESAEGASARPNGALDARGGVSFLAPRIASEGGRRGTSTRCFPTAQPRPKSALGAAP